MTPGNNNNSNRSTLPLPELNPLINPVLGAHMGRWAEVYFTAPPEKREEAVLELLRELGAAPTTAPVSAPERVARESAQPLASPKVSAPVPEPIEETDQEWIVCEACGGRNTVGNRFCGMCATPLPQADNAASSPTKAMWGSIATRHPDDILNERISGEAEKYGYENSRQENARHENGRYENGHAEEEFHESINLEAVGESRASRSSASNWPERPDVPSLIPEYDEAPSRRRIYLGAVVALLMVGLVYFAWRRSSAGSETAHSLPQQAPAAAEMQPATPDQAPAPSLQGDPSQSPPPKTPATVERRSAVTTSRPSRKSDTSNKELKPAPPAVQTSDQATGPIVASLQDNGSAELTVAESYLNGTHGKARDTSEAAKWLWRSFGKKSGVAALLLSDLYVRGDGVPQSCDQARLLLDAAARKGTSGAAERLRNLPSLGCQ